MNDFIENLFRKLFGERVIMFFDKEIINKPWIYLDYWSFLHLSAGLIAGYFFPAYVVAWIWIMVAWETLELLMFGLRYKGHNVIVDGIYDIVFGLLGFILVSTQGRILVLGF